MTGGEESFICIVPSILLLVWARWLAVLGEEPVYIYLSWLLAQLEAKFSESCA